MSVFVSGLQLIRKRVTPCEWNRALSAVRDWPYRGSVWEWLHWEGPAISISHHGQDLGGHSSEAAMEHRAHRVLDAAWNNGIRYFDVARSYGRGEKFLGSWLRSRSISQSAVTVGSKWGYTYTADWKIQAPSHEIKNHTLSTLQKQWRESISWLNGYLDLYQIHSATMESGVLDDQSVLDELAHLKSEGTHIGLSLSGPDQAATLRKAMACISDGLPLFRNRASDLEFT